MSSPLAIAGVSAVLRDLLNNGLIDANIPGALGTTVTVTVSPPDRIKIDGSDAQNQLNLFLHQVTPNAAWRNVGLPSRDDRGARLSNPPLALDLHYLLTAYGREDLQAEILLGYAMHLLHEVPVLDRQAIRTALSAGAVDASFLPPAFRGLSATDLADQVEQVKITPTALSNDDMSKLWTALQAHYRPSAAYQVSVVLIEAKRPTRSALPVLTRGVVAEPGLLPPIPTLTAVTFSKPQIAAQLGNQVTLDGHHLDGTNIRLRFEHRLRQDAIELSPDADPVPSANRIAVTIPNDAAAKQNWPAGVWTVSVSVRRPGEPQPRTTNSLPMLLGPTIDIGASTVSRSAHAVTITLCFGPEARPPQKVGLNADGREALNEPFPVDAHGVPLQTGTLRFVFPVLDAGQQLVRLRIDGVDSPLVDRSVSPPRFDSSQQLNIPA